MSLQCTGVALVPFILTGRWPPVSTTCLEGLWKRMQILPNPLIKAALMQNEGNFHLVKKKVKQVFNCIFVFAINLKRYEHD